MMMMIYMIYAANWADVIEVPLGANVIPKGTALEYSAIIPMYYVHALLQKNVFSYIFLP